MRRRFRDGRVFVAVLCVVGGVVADTKKTTTFTRGLDRKKGRGNPIGFLQSNTMKREHFDASVVVIQKRSSKSRALRSKQHLFFYAPPGGATFFFSDALFCAREMY